MEFEFLSKVWYIDNDCRFPAIVLNKVDEQPFYYVMVYYGGIWESLLASPDKLINRKEDWSDKMFGFRYQTMDVDELTWNFV